MNNEIDLEQYAIEMKELGEADLAEIYIHPFTAIAIIKQIQLATRIQLTWIDDSELDKVNKELNKVAIKAGKRIQELFDKNSEVYKSLEMGWNIEHNRAIRHEQ
ncbi:hypothetical protein QUA03_28115 [Microcoleus sp. S36b_A4]|uniref:hypothetical protein n=1 Tax=Microcoleus sp. S36b_A4 TaxID=3055420 RepID=UPI002FD701DD